MTPIACPDHGAVIEYLYGEGDGEACRDIETHVRRCEACTAEITALRGLRADLRAWRPPERRLGFRIVQDEGPGTPWRWLPAWGLAAAAVLVLAAAAAVAQIEVRYGPDGLAIRTGWGARAAASVETGPVPPTSVVGRTDLVALERRLQAEIARAHDEARPETGVGSRAVGVPSGPATADEAQVLSRVRALIIESERRQERELALRVAQLARDLDVQRRGDFVRIQQGLGRLEGMTGAEVARQRELLNYLVRVSQR